MRRHHGTPFDSRRVARTRIVLPVAAAALAVLASACSDDGREMREPEFPAPETTTTTLNPPPGGGTG